jgi:hypothetical protein
MPSPIKLVKPHLSKNSSERRGDGVDGGGKGLAAQAEGQEGAEGGKLEEGGREGQAGSRLPPPQLQVFCTTIESAAEGRNLQPWPICPQQPKSAVREAKMGEFSTQTTTRRDF